MKSVCSIHEQAYDVGGHCPYCDPALNPDDLPVLCEMRAPDGYEYHAVAIEIITPTTVTQYDPMTYTDILKHYYAGVK